MTANSEAVASSRDDEQIDADPRVREHLSTGNGKLQKRVAAQFGRSTTKAEEILVAPCRIIHAREMQYFAEAISNVAVRSLWNLPL